MFGLSAGGGALSAMAAAGGMSPTDPRIQPFIKKAREEAVQLQAKVFISNGMSETIARQEAERSVTIDKNVYFGQALLKYFESLSGGTSAISQAAAVSYSPWTIFAMPHQQFQQPPMATPYPPPVTGGSRPVSTAQNPALQQLLQGISNVVASKTLATGLPEHKAPSTGVADVVAAAQANVTRSRLSRFDVPSPPLTGLPQHQQRMTSSSDQSVSPYFSQMCNLQERSVATTVPPPVNLDSKLQIWKYHVFSSHKKPPRNMQGEQWRSILNQFVQKRERQVRDANVIVAPEWLINCWKPTVAEILSETGASDSPYSHNPTAAVAPPSSSVPPQPDAPVAKGERDGITASLSPVSSSDESSPREAKRQRSSSAGSSRSSMSKSSVSSSSVITRRGRRNYGADVSKGDALKRVRLSSIGFTEYNSLTLNSGAKKKKKSERKATRTATTTAEERRKRDARLRRFGLNRETLSTNADSEAFSLLTTSEGLRMMTWQEKIATLTSIERVVGQSQLLEKPYLRLCGPPDPALVRPEHVLRQALKHCIDKWRSEKDYRFIEEQFRSIRQDMTVQGIRNAFTIEVYETNARVALENSDLGQFNQCQTQLRELHKSLSVPLEGSNREEFLCYRLLYLSLMNMRHDLLKLSGELTAEEKQLDGVKFADAFRRAFIEGNFHRVLKLSIKGPFLSSTLIHIFLNRLRMTYLVLIARAHYTAGIGYLRDELMFSTSSECERFLNEGRAVWTNERHGSIDCRKSLPIFEASPLLQTRKIKALG